MYCWETVDRDCVLTGDRYFRVPVVEEGTPEKPRIDPKILSPQSSLDCDLP